MTRHLTYDAEMERLHARAGSSLPESVRLVEGQGRLPRLDIASRAAAAQVYFHGAHLASWHPSHAGSPVLWMSGHSFFQMDKPIRGGVPICFPWFGPHATNPAAPAHGFARTSEWNLVEAEEASGLVRLAFALDDADAGSPVWPYPFRATYRLAIGSTLSMALEVRNTSSEPFTFEEALHTYFAVQDIDGVRIAGLEKVEYIDKVAQFAHRRQEEELLTFTRETDRVYLDSGNACVIHDAGLRRITISKAHSGATVVWNPWIDKARAMADFGDGEWRGMVCVETANVGASAVRLDPGAAHTMTARIDVERA